ncbi:MAG: FixH family protein, partial [Gammaproteobacteria bacterium]
RTGFTTAILTSVIYIGFAIRYWQGGDVFAIHLALYLVTVYILTVLTHQRMTAGKGRFKLHWAPAAIVGFFVVVVGFDSVFVYLAQRGIGPDWAQRILPAPRSGNAIESRYPGIISHDFQEKEAMYNAYQAERARQRQLGWHSRIGWARAAVMNQDNRLMVMLKDDQHRAIDNARIRGRFLFPGDARRDKVFEMHPAGGGLYTADLKLGRAGTWDLILSIRRNSDKLELRTTTTIEHPLAQHD